MRAGPGSRTGGRSRLPPLRRTPTAPPSAAGVAGSSRGACRPVRLVCGQGLRGDPGGGVCVVLHLTHHLRKRPLRNLAHPKSSARGPGGLSLRPCRGPARARRDMGPGPGGRGAAGWGWVRGWGGIEVPGAEGGRSGMTPRDRHSGGARRAAVVHAAVVRAAKTPAHRVYGGSGSLAVRRTRWSPVPNSACGTRTWRSWLPWTSWP